MTTVRTEDVLRLAREFSESLRRAESERDRERRFPHEEMAALKKAGLLGLLVPESLGGFGASYETAAEVMMILAESDSIIAQMTQPHTGGVEALKVAGSPAVRNRILSRVAREGLMLTNAYSETGTKTVSELDYKTRLRREGDHYLLNGTKFYSTGCFAADMFFVPALLEGTGEIHLVFCGTHDPGVTIVDDWDGMGQRTTASGTTIFENVVIPEQMCLSGDPFLHPNLLGPILQVLLAAIYVGIAQAALRDTVEYARVKTKPWLHAGVETARQDPYILWHIGEMQTLVHSAEAMVARAARSIDSAAANLTAEARAEASVMVAESKIVATNVSLQVCERLFQVCGTRATRAEYNFERHWRNARTLTLHDPVDYKYKLVGDYVLNGTPPPISGYT